MTVIASYPRSGSTYLRYLISHALYPDIDHDMDSVNRHVPTIENTWEIMNSIPNPKFYKTHDLRHGQNIVLLHRHVGDCLISEYHYHKHYYGIEKTLNEFIIELDFGANWRKHVDHYCMYKRISFEDLVRNPAGSVYAISRVGGTLLSCTFEESIKKVNFDNLKKSDPSFFRSGETGQWESLDQEIKTELLVKNRRELKLLGYL